jgi:hypothetical protein
MFSPIMDVSCRGTPFSCRTTSVDPSLNGQAKENSYHINGRIIKRSSRNNGRINNHWSQICHCDLIRSISPTRFCCSISSARSRSLHIVRRISSVNPFDLPPDLFSRSTSFHARPRRQLDFVSRSIKCLCISTRRSVFNLLVRVAA